MALLSRYAFVTGCRGLATAALAALALLSVTPASLVRAAGGVTLFDANDAAQLRLDATAWREAAEARRRPGNAADKGMDLDGFGSERGVAAPVGPRITVQQPKVQTEADAPVIQARSPADLTLLFEENGHPIDMSSLEITARKGWFSKSLTPLLKPYLHGTKLEASRVEIPEGRFLIEIEIGDSQGAKTKESYFLVVSEK